MSAPKEDTDVFGYVHDDEEDTDRMWHDHEPEDDPRDRIDGRDREYCPHCNGTNISPYAWDGGGCPHCFGAYQ